MEIDAAVEAHARHVTSAYFRPQSPQTGHKVSAVNGG
jgi:hypothetical protein